MMPTVEQMNRGGASLQELLSMTTPEGSSVGTQTTNSNTIKKVKILRDKKVKFRPNQDIDLTPPEAAQNHAQDVLDWRSDDDKTVSGMTDTGWARARQLASGEALSPGDIQEIFAWFQRHGPEEYELNDDDMDSWQDNGRVAIKGWGGPAMREWVGPKRRRLAEMGELEPVANVKIRLNATRYSEGNIVNTPDGVGVVVDVLTEPDEEAEIDASDSSPTYAVVVESEGTGVGFYKASELSTGEIDVPVENPEGDVAEMAANAESVETFVANAIAQLKGNQDGRFQWPESWRDSDTPARVIALKAWAGMNGSVDGCIREMRGNITRPGAFCADFADRLYGTDYWRGDSWAPGD